MKTRVEGKGGELLMTDGGVLSTLMSHEYGAPVAGRLAAECILGAGALWPTMPAGSLGRETTSLFSELRAKVRV